FQPRAVDDGSFAGGSRDAPGVAQFVAAVAGPHVQIDSAHTESVDLAVQLTDEGDGFVHVAVGADAFHPHPLSQKFQFGRMIPLGGPDTDADNPFQANAPPYYVRHAARICSMRRG